MRSERIEKTEKVDLYFDVYLWKKVCHLAGEMRVSPEEVLEFFLQKRFNQSRG